MRKLKLVDWIIVSGLILALVVGLFTYNHFRQSAGKKIEATSKIGFQVYLRGVTLTGTVAPIKKGDTTFITIRNIPYTELKVIDVKVDTKKTIVPNPKPSKQQFIMIDDYSQAFLYDLVVTLVDTAKITKDGAVVGGNKIKIGLPVTLEGDNYKFTGTVSDMQILPDMPAEQPKQQESDKDATPKPDITKQDKNLG